MHDLKFVNEIVYILKRELAKLGKDAGSRPVVVNVALSKMCHVKPDGLRATFSKMTEGEPFRNVTLNIHPMEFDMFCRTCKKLSKVSEPVLSCPSCHGADLEIGVEKEFFVESIEVEGME